MPVWPNGSKSRPHVSSGFGPRRAPIAGASTYHRGTDFSQTFSLIRAVEAGVVAAINVWPALGYSVWIQHDGFFSKSGHMKNWPAVRVGEHVAEGRILGVMGQTGTATDDHLHFEITPGTVHYSNTGQVDPVPYLSNRISSPSGGGSSSPGGFLMALSDAQQREIYNVLCGDQQTQFGEAIGINPTQQTQMHEVLVGGQQKAYARLLAGVVADEVHGRRIVRQGRPGLAGGGTNLSSMLAWNDEHVTATLDAIHGAALSETQVKLVADAVMKSIGKPGAKVDYAAITKVVNDDVASRLPS